MQHSICDLSILLAVNYEWADYIILLAESGSISCTRFVSLQLNLLFSAAMALIHSFVLVWNDYCNSIIVGLPKFRLPLLQWLLIYPGQVVTNQLDYT